jgi:hypothetical protein
MMKWLMKFTLEIAPPVAATVIGAFVVHQLWPSDKPDVQPAVTPPAAQVSTEPAKPASPPRVISTKKADSPGPSEEASVTPTTPPIGTGKTARQSSDVAKTNPPPRENVFERAEKALAAIPPAKSGSSTEAHAPARTTAVVPLPPVPPPQQSAQPDTTAVTPVTAPPATTTAVVTPVSPPPMDPPREVTSTVSVTPPPPPQVAPRDRNPLRVYHSDRANLADIPMADGDEVPPPPQTAAAAPPAEQAPQGPPREKNIVENILGSLHSVLPERLR